MPAEEIKQTGATKDAAMIIGAFTSIAIGLPQSISLRMEVADIIKTIVRTARKETGLEQGFEKPMLEIASFLDGSEPQVKTLNEKGE